MVGAIINRVAYGYKIDAVAAIDPLIELAETVVADFSESIKPGAWLVDTIPICERVFPSPKRRALELHVIRQCALYHLGFPAQGFRRLH